MPLVRLLDMHGEPFGYLIGYPIDLATGELLRADRRYDVVPGSIDTFYAEHIEDLQGNFIAILAIGGEQRLYLDAMGTLSVVYDPEARAVGGAASDLLDEQAYADRFDAELHEKLGVAQDGWFPNGLTAHTGIVRLLPNHYLDLTTFRPVRHTMCASFADTPAEADDVADAIVTQVRGVTQALLAAGCPIAVGLTGGYDSRLLLAALRGMTDKVLFYTVAGPGSTFDLVRAKELAERFGLQHKILPFATADDAQKAEWDLRVGDCLRTVNRVMHPSVFPLEEYACIGGWGGEIGRCFLWRDMASVPGQIEAVHIVDRLKLNRVDKLVAGIDRWLEDFAGVHPLTTLDMAYIEQRSGPWALAQSYANPRSLVFHPIGSARTIAGMLSLPPEVRQDDGLIRRAIERAWPELLELPINRYGDRRDMVASARRLLNPGRVARKVRQVVRQKLA